MSIFDAPTGRHIRTLAGLDGAAHGLAFSRDGLRLASASVERTVKVWDGTAGVVVLNSACTHLLAAPTYGPIVP